MWRCPPHPGRVVEPGYIASELQADGNVAIQAGAATSTMVPGRVMTQRRRRFLSRVLMPAKNRTTA